MTAKEYCLANPVCAIYSNGLWGLEIHGIEYGIDDHMYVATPAPGGGKAYHRLKIYTSANGNSFVKYYTRRIPLNECMRTGTGWD